MDQIFINPIIYRYNDFQKYVFTRNPGKYY